MRAAEQCKEVAASFRRYANRNMSKERRAGYIEEAEALEELSRELRLAWRLVLIRRRLESRRNRQ